MNWHNLACGDIVWWYHAFLSAAISSSVPIAILCKNRTNRIINGLQCLRWSTLITTTITAYSTISVNRSDKPSRAADRFLRVELRSTLLSVRRLTWSPLYDCCARTIADADQLEESSWPWQNRPKSTQTPPTLWDRQAPVNPQPLLNKEPVPTNLALCDYPPLT